MRLLEKTTASISCAITLQPRPRCGAHRSSWTALGGVVSMGQH